MGDASAILLRPERRYIVLSKPIEWTDMKQQQTTRPGPTERSTTALSARGAAPARRSTGRTQDIDRHVGARVRERRIMLGLTQQQLADLIGVTYQQAHKYERGRSEEHTSELQ